MGMITNNRFLSIFLISLMVTSILFNVLTPARAKSGRKTKIYIYPKRTSYPWLDVGDEFKIKLLITNVDDLYGYEFKLNYNPEILDFDGISSSFINEPSFKFKKTNEESGVIWFATTSMHPARPKRGSGVLATITFQVVGEGESVLDIYNTKLLNTDVKRISHTVKDGYFRNGPGSGEEIEILEEEVLGTSEESYTEESGVIESTEFTETMTYPLSGGGVEVCDRMDNNDPPNGHVDEPDVCLPGDVDHVIEDDDKYHVGLEDLEIVGLAFGSSVGETRYDDTCLKLVDDPEDPEYPIDWFCDMYGPDKTTDGIANIFDLAWVGKNFGNEHLAGCVDVTVEDGTPLEGADVYVVDPSQLFGTTNSTGQVTRCCLLDPESYELYAIYNGAQFCPNTDLTVDSTGTGSATIIGGNYKVTIHVQESDGTPIFDAYVKIMTGTGDFIEDGFTEIDGNYETCLEDGDYWAHIIHPTTGAEKDAVFTVPDDTYVLVEY